MGPWAGARLAGVAAADGWVEQPEQGGRPGVCGPQPAAATHRQWLANFRLAGEEFYLETVGDFHAPERLLWRWGLCARDNRQEQNERERQGENADLKLPK